MKKFLSFILSLLIIDLDEVLMSPNYNTTV